MLWHILGAPKLLCIHTRVSTLFYPPRTSSREEAPPSFSVFISDPPAICLPDDFPPFPNCAFSTLYTSHPCLAEVFCICATAVLTYQKISSFSPRTPPVNIGSQFTICCMGKCKIVSDGIHFPRKMSYPNPCP